MNPIFMDEAERHVGQPKPIGPQKDTLKAEFGLLMISPSDFWFFIEQPGHWQETVDGTAGYERFLRSVAPPVSDDQEGLGGLIPFNYRRLKMDQVESLRIITSRVPAIELEYRTETDGSLRQVVFSMQSDYFTQETLNAMKRLKKLRKINKKK